MKAVLLEEHGDADAFVIKDIAEPICGDDQVIVNVKACSINHLDIFVRKGMPGHPIKLPIIPGGDASGEVIQIGSNVSSKWLGKRVLIDPNIVLESGRIGIMGEDTDGVLREQIAVEESRLLELDDKIDFNSAACLPIAYGAAWRMLITNGNIKPGEQVLILGASGGVGNACVQIARMKGCFVIAATSSDEKGEKLKELGADMIINYNDEPEFHRTVRSLTGDGVDVAVNYTGGDTWVRTLKCMKTGGRILTCGATAGFDPKTDIRFIWRKEIKIQGSNSWTKEDIQLLLDSILEGKIVPVIHKVIPFEQINTAHTIIENREMFGKVIISFQD